jgi:hypothetical protein
MPELRAREDSVATLENKSAFLEVKLSGASVNVMSSM